MLLATIISRLFEPLAVLTALTILFASKSGLTQPEFLRFVRLFITVMLMPPVFLLALSLRRKWIATIDVSNRKTRVAALLVFLPLVLLDVILVRSFHNNLLNYLFLLYTSWFIGFLLVSLRWKISGHTGIAMLSVILFLKQYGYAWRPLIFLIPLIGWARIRGKYHSLGEVLGGVAYSIIVYVAFQSLFNFITYWLSPR